MKSLLKLLIIALSLTSILQTFANPPGPNNTSYPQSKDGIDNDTPGV